MAYIFNSQEQAEIESARLKAPAGDEVNSVSADGNWVAFYTTLSNLLGRHLAARELGFEDRRNFTNAKLWLDVAIGANAGIGMHGAFIRSFTDRQGELRRGSAFSTVEMQKASNGVALNFYLDITGRRSGSKVIPWTVPSIDQIAAADASSIGVNLFGSSSAQPLASDDDAVSENSAWSGTLGFSLLGGFAPFETWRLLNDRTRNDIDGQGNLDSLDD
ncbi:hypothetical protein, partial [Paracidovorax cattleyae]|uniref:hypothetical protein n=1 Tax=Paracidovorax cattleyae TaxID=80868 RepID=UPI001A17331A